VQAVDSTDPGGSVPGVRPILSTRALSRHFDIKGGKQQVLKDIDLSIGEGTFTSLIGPSGCGKSSLLLCLAGLLAPSSGSVEMAGRPVSGPPDELTYVFQQYSKSVFPWRTVRQNVEFGMEIAGVGRAERAERARNMLTRVGLEGFDNRFPAQLSGGMQQRVAIARALVCRPRVILMDEPFSAVDALTRAQLQDLLLDIWQEAGLTIVFVTHDVEEAVYLSDRVVALGRDASGITIDMDISLDRPRHQLSTRETRQFTEHRHQLLDLVLSQHEA
jgi:NitT/TauT family transport system ATP-binding protein